MARRKVGLAPFLACLAALVAASVSQPAEAAVQKIGHVFIIVLENESFDRTFGARSPAKYLKSLARKGALLRNYYAIGHNSLGNYIAMVSGQAPNPATQTDCRNYIDFVSTGMDKDGQALGQGCIYPKSIRTIASQIGHKSNSLTWKAYMEDMGNKVERERPTCGHPPIGEKDNTQKADAADQYATRHNPFMYFHSVIDDEAACDAHVVNLSRLANDIKNEKTTPNYVFIAPNLCHDGHDKPCIDGAPGGLSSADKFLMQYVPDILNSPAYRKDGLLIITFDEADSDDATACCNEKHPPNIKPGSKLVWGPGDEEADHGAGITGPGGGRIGAVLLSRFIKPGTVSRVGYNHYSLLRSVEDVFGLGHLGYARQKGLRSFGRDVFTKPGG